MRYKSITENEPLHDILEPLAEPVAAELSPTTQARSRLSSRPSGGGQPAMAPAQQAQASYWMDPGSPCPALENGILAAGTEALGEKYRIRLKTWFLSRSAFLPHFVLFFPLVLKVNTLIIENT